MSKYKIGDTVIYYNLFDTRAVFYKGKVLGIHLGTKTSYEVSYNQLGWFKLKTQTTVDEKRVFPYRRISLEKLNKKMEKLNEKILEEVKELNKMISDKFENELEEIITKSKLKEKK